MGLHSVSGHPLRSSAGLCAASLSHVREPLRSRRRSEFACLPVISHSPFCKRLLVFDSKQPPRLLTPYRAPLIASYHDILVFFLIVIPSAACSSISPYPTLSPRVAS